MSDENSVKTETARTICTACDEETYIKKPNCLFDKITVNSYAIICFAMSILLTVIISAATLMRYILNVDLYGYEEWIKIFAFWLYFMGAGYGAFAGTHVSADLVQSYLKPSFFKRFMLVVRNVITVCVTGLFAWYGWVYFTFDRLGPLGDGSIIPKSVAWRIPQWWSSLPIFIGLVSMFYYFGWDLWRSLVDLVKGRDAK
jgi:TRAP-type C4-dicarboxylate transport system permease small subunit